MCKFIVREEDHVHVYWIHVIYIIFIVFCMFLLMNNAVD